MRPRPGEVAGVSGCGVDATTRPRPRARKRQASRRAAATRILDGGLDGRLLPSGGQDVMIVGKPPFRPTPGARAVMRPAFARAFAAVVLIGALSSAARANIPTGVPAPDFTKSQLAGGPGAWTKGGPISLSAYAGKVVVLFLLGYG